MTNFRLGLGFGLGFGLGLEFGLWLGFRLGLGFGLGFVGIQVGVRVGYFRLVFSFDLSMIGKQNCKLHFLSLLKPSLSLT